MRYGLKGSVSSAFREIIRHITIWFSLIRINFMSQMEYRTNFVTGILMETGYLATKVMYVLVAYKAGTRIAGYSPDEILVFVGTFVTLTGFYVGVFMMNLFQLSNLVRDGSFDMILVKPVNSLFFASLRRSEPGGFLLDTAAGLIMVAIGLVRLAGQFNPLRLFGWALFAASGSIVAYALWFLPMTLVFLLVRADSLAGLADSFWDFNNVPMIVYNRIGQALGVFIIPIFVITNFPTLFVIGRLPAIWCVWGLIAPFIWIFITASCWNASIKHYASGGN